MSIPCLPANASIEEQTRALEQAGCLVLTDVLTDRRRQAVREELSSHMAQAHVLEADKDDPAMFYPGRTRRISGLVASSKIAGEMVLDPHSTALCDQFLTPNSEFGYQLHVTAALEVGPGARKQVLHREDDSFTFFPQPRPNLILASMWAISDFTADNGATLLVPGSHLWPEERVAQPEEVVAAEMPAGAVLYWLGSTLHGAGANVSEQWRYGIIFTYSLGWLRQEENQYLDVPPHIAKNLSPQLRDMIGYKMYRALGFSMDPILGERPD